MSHFKRKASTNDTVTSGTMHADRRRYNQVHLAWRAGWGSIATFLALDASFLVLRRQMEISALIYVPIALGLVLGAVVVATNHRELKRLREVRRIIDRLTDVLNIRVGREPMKRAVFSRPSYGLVEANVRAGGWVVTYFNIGDNIAAEPALQFAVFDDRLHDLSRKDTVLSTPLNRSYVRSATEVLDEGTRK